MNRTENLPRTLAALAAALHALRQRLVHVPEHLREPVGALADLVRDVPELLEVRVAVRQRRPKVPHQLLELARHLLARLLQ